MKDLIKKWREIEDKLGIKAFEEVQHYYSTLIMKINDLIISRDNWKRKYKELKEGKR